MPEALTSTGGRRSAGVRSSACTRAVVADNRLERSSAMRCRVHGQRPMLAPARFTTPCAPATSLTQSPSSLRASQVTKRTPFGGSFVTNRRLRTTTSWPSLARLFTRWLPIKPDPPLIRTFILILCSLRRAGTAIGRRPDCEDTPTLSSPAGGRKLWVEATRPAFGASLLQAFLGQGEQRNAIELAALAGGHAGIDREADDVTVRTGRIGMLLENRTQPVRLPDRDRPIGFRDDEAELAVLDAGQRVDAARLRADDSNEFPEHPAEPAFAVLTAQNFEGLDLEQHYGEVVVVTRRAADLFFYEFLQERLTVGSRLAVEQGELLRLDQLATHHQGIQTLADKALQRAQWLLEVFARTVEAHYDGAEGPLPLLLGDRNADDAPLLDDVVRQVA